MAGTDLAQRAREVKPADARTARDAVEDNKGEIAKALGDRMDASQFVRAVFTTFTQNPELEACDERSLIAGILWAAQLGLTIGMGLNQFHLTPRNNSVMVGRDPSNNKAIYEKRQMCVPMIGYQGYIDLSYRHPKVLDFQLVRVRSNDIFTYDYTTETGKRIKWAPQLPIDIKDKYVGGIVRSSIAGGGVVETYMHVSEIEARRPEYSKEQDDGKGHKWMPKTPWASDYEAMCDKTILRKHSVLMPKSTELASALALDGRALKYVDGQIESALDDDADGDSGEAVPA